MADSDAPRISAHSIPAPEATERLRAQATASYEARPEEVNRVLLLYSGGLDTSVMLKWIQDEYEAEVVTLTVNRGQPGEDYEVVEGKARRLGAVETFVVDAREEFARDFIVPAIKANAIYGRSEEHTSELQSRQYLVCRLLLEKKNMPPLHTTLPQAPV